VYSNIFLLVNVTLMVGTIILGEGGLPDMTDTW